MDNSLTKNMMFAIKKYNFILIVFLLLQLLPVYAQALSCNVAPSWTQEPVYMLELTRVEEPVIDTNGVTVKADVKLVRVYSGEDIERMQQIRQVYFPYEKLEYAFMHENGASVGLRLVFFRWPTLEEGQSLKVHGNGYEHRPGGGCPDPKSTIIFVYTDPQWEQKESKMAQEGYRREYVRDSQRDPLTSSIDALHPPLWTSEKQEKSIRTTTDKKIP